MKVRGVNSFLKLGGQVVMRRAAAAGGAVYSAKIWGGTCPPCPPFTDAPESHMPSPVEPYIQPSGCFPMNTFQILSYTSIKSTKGMGWSTIQSRNIKENRSQYFQKGRAKFITTLSIKQDDRIMSSQKYCLLFILLCLT